MAQGEHEPLARLSRGWLFCVIEADSYSIRRRGGLITLHMGKPQRHGWEGRQLSEDGAVFRAAFPTIQSAIKIYGDKQGMRIQFDVPESEMGEALKLLMWRERVLVVTVRPENDGTKSAKWHI